MLGNGLSLSIGSQQQTVGGGGGAAVTLNPTTGVNKYSGITLSGGNLTMAVDSSTNLQFVRATRAAGTGAVQFEVTVVDNSNITIAIEDGTQDFSVAGSQPATEPGNTPHATSGFSFNYVSGNGLMNFIFNSAFAQTPACTIANSDKLTFQLNPTAGTIIVLLRGVQLGTTITGMVWANWYAALGAIRNAVTPELTVNFAGPFSFGANAAY